MEDEVLLKKAKEGNSDAIDKLIIKYRSVVEIVAAKYKNSPLERDDLIQEGMIGLLAAIKSYNSKKGAKFSTYAAHCINNSVSTALNKVSRMKDIPRTELTDLEDAEIESQYGLSAEDEYLAKDSVHTLDDILQKELSGFENEVLRLHMTGCSYGEIAKKLNKDTKAVDNAIQRIRKKLNRVAF